jgi:SAM-dependent methyltransferase
MANKVAKLLSRTVLEHTNIGSHLLMKLYYGVTGPHGYPDAPWTNGVLKKQEEVKASIDQVRKLGLPIRDDPPKNWDSLAALDLILRTTTSKARIFDAGGELYSMILPWLFLYGYRNLIAANLEFRKTTRRGSIVYEKADITQTTYPDETFDAITCLSVIEHGVDLNAYFREMSRLLKVGGVLITSADYWETPIDTRGQMEYGVPIHVFTKEEIIGALKLARQYGFGPLSPLDLASEEKVVHWKEHDLHYTFVIFSMQKDG